jgi:hypothetical protein
MVCRGKLFEGEIAQSARAQGLLYTPIPLARQGVKGCHSSPYDGFLVVGPYHLAVEMKSLRLHGSFPLSSVVPHQAEALTRCATEGAASFLLLRMGRRKLENGKETPDIVAFCLPMALWSALVRDVERVGRKSVPLAWFSDPLRFARVPRLPRTRTRAASWDLRTGLAEAAKLLSRPSAVPASAPLAGILPGLLKPLRSRREAA